MKRTHLHRRRFRIQTPVRALVDVVLAPDVGF